jgi:large subunit ribosomal protein L21
MTEKTEKKETKVAKAPAKAKKAADTFAVIETGGKQYRVESGTILDFEKLEGEANAKISFDKVLLISDGKETKIGQPYVEGATVKGSILEHKKAKKELVFKWKRKTGYKKTQGHRQQLTTVKIESI